jgi:hypothetical protein
MDQQFKRGTRRHPRKQPNAMKHGVFTLITILPGEDPKLFAALHSGLIRECNPDSIMQEDAVLTMGKGIWLKARIERFLRGKIVARRLDPSHPAFDRILALQQISGVLKVAPYCIDELINCLPKDIQGRLKLKFPELEFETVAERAQAIRNEIDSIILPELQVFEKPLDISFLEASDLVPPEEFMHAIALEERIDAMIDRAIKRLMHLKVIQPMLDQQKIDRKLGARPRLWGSRAGKTSGSR